MKQLILSLLIVCGVAATGSAQVKALQTAKIKTPTALCEQCKERIETYLKRYDGITMVNVNFRTKETTVKYLSDRTDIEQIKTAIANAGYDADDVPANPESYNRLPITCKKPEDGGHQKKH
ncbi:MAG: heavy-metal-associated domain-containing protein [Chitinophagaceae bacterium]